MVTLWVVSPKGKKSTVDVSDKDLEWIFSFMRMNNRNGYRTLFLVKE
jgi:hypothetical protein